MSPSEICNAVCALVDCNTYSPGQAFDALLELRKAKITPAQIHHAFVGGKATPDKPFVESPKDDAEVTDETIMWFGAHRGKLMKEVPGSYFAWLWRQRPLKDKRMEAYLKKTYGIKDNDDIGTIPF